MDAWSKVVENQDHYYRQRLKIWLERRGLSDKELRKQANERAQGDVTPASPMRVPLRGRGARHGDWTKNRP